MYDAEASYLLQRCLLARLALDLRAVLAGGEDRDGLLTFLTNRPRDFHLLKPATTVAFGLCGRCKGMHADRDVDGEVFGNCIRCQADLVEVALELQVDPPSVGH